MRPQMVNSPSVISQVLSSLAFSCARSGPGSASSSSLTFGKPTSSKFRTRNGQGKARVVTNCVSRTVFCVPLTHIITWASARSPCSNRAMNALRTACLRTEWTWLVQDPQRLVPNHGASYGIGKSGVRQNLLISRTKYRRDVSR